MDVSGIIFDDAPLSHALLTELGIHLLFEGGQEGNQAQNGKKMQYVWGTVADWVQPNQRGEVYIGHQMMGGSINIRGMRRLASDLCQYDDAPVADYVFLCWVVQGKLIWLWKGQFFEDLIWRDSLSEYDSWGSLFGI
jgi:hypothetical protein